MKTILSPLASLLLASAILLAGNGLQGTLIAIRANIEGFPIPYIGLLMSAYYVGFMAGCYYNPEFVRRVGHIRTFAALASVASAAALLHTFVIEPFTWLALRAITGFCFAGLYMIAESWINERAENENRGRILSVYRMVDLGATAIGQVLLTLADPGSYALFAIVSILVSISLVPVALTTSVAPRPIETSKIDFVKVLQVSPLAAWGACAAGLSSGAFWGLAPVFVLNVGFATNDVALFMSAVIIGGAVAQYPVGLISDRIDRRIVFVTIAFLGCIASCCVAFSPSIGLRFLILSGFAYGAMALSLYSMAVAHANDRAAQDEFVEVSSALLFLFGVGASIGPFLAAFVVNMFEARALFLYTATVQAILVLFGLYRLTVRSGVLVQDKVNFVPSPRTTPEVLDLDPRSDVNLTDT